MSVVRMIFTRASYRIRTDTLSMKTVALHPGTAPHTTAISNVMPRLASAVIVGLYV
jgi:hypothetical protein